MRVGFLQRSSVYWPTDHEARANSPGIAVIRGHTAYQVPVGRIVPGFPPPNRPGVPPVIVTWADKDYLADFCSDLARAAAEGRYSRRLVPLGPEARAAAYMTEIAHAAIDAGADIVMGHGAHYALPVEIYKGRPIFYGLCNLVFGTGHRGRKHSGWVGIVVELEVERRKPGNCSFRLVRSNAGGETYLCRLADETETFEDLAKRSLKLGARFLPDGDRVRVTAL